MRYCLGLDMDVASLGWVVVETDVENTPIRVVDMGVRKYDGGRDKEKNMPLAQKRRQQRAMRRQRERYLRRRTKLLNLLTKLDLQPADAIQRRQVADCTHPDIQPVKSKTGEKIPATPYTLRAKAVQKKLTQYELGRVLFALIRRRGFESNRGEDSAISKKFYDGISELDKKIIEGGFKSLGEYFAHLEAKDAGILDKRSSHEEIQRTGLQTSREMYKNEFHQIRKKQSPHQKLTAKNWDNIYKAIFDQRPLKKVERGVCQIYGTQGIDADWVKRAYKADPLAQSLRIWKDINNLKVLIPEQGQQRHLTNEERSQTYNLLNTQKSITFGRLRESLKLPANAVFNLDKAKKGRIKGSETDLFMADDALFGASWYELDASQKTRAITLLQSTEKEESLIDALENQYGLSPEAAENAVFTKLEAGTSRFCPRALEELISLLSTSCVDKEANRYISLTEAVDELVDGRIRPDELAEKLGYYAAMMPEVGMHHKYRSTAEEKRFGIIGNPTVHIGLNQLRHVVNAIIQTYGHPTSVAIEVARDLKMNADQKRIFKKIQNENNKKRIHMAQECTNANVPVNEHSREDFLRYKLWCELDTDPCNRKCPYTGKTIRLKDVFSRRVNIEYILPRSRTLDDSPANLTLSMRDANESKGNLTPYEYYINVLKDPAAYDDMLARIATLPKNKRWRFTQEAMQLLENENIWHDNLLNDTRYISNVARRYLEYISPDVRVSPGKLTAKARYQWLGKVLEKNREEDHRHHTIDALTVALLNRRALQEASKANKSDDELIYKEIQIPCPMDKDTLNRQVVDLVSNTVVSHRPDHRIEGGLHKDTALRHSDDRVVKAEDDPARRRALVRIPHQQGDHLHQNYYEHGGVHHIDFWQLPSVDKKPGKVQGVPVYMHEANPPKDHPKKQTRPHPQARFIMRLHKGDVVMTDKEEENQLVIIRRINPSKGNENLVYTPANLLPDNKVRTLGFSSILRYNTRKVHVDVLGRVKVGPKNQTTPF